MDGEELGLIDGAGTEEFPLEDAGLDQGDDGAGADDGALGGDEGAEGADQRENQRDDESQDAGGAAGRRLDANSVRTALKAALEGNEELAKKFPGLEKAVTRALFKSQQVDSLGGLQKFRQIAEELEIHGGLEGITEMREEVEAARSLEDGFRIGDPKLVEGWSKDYPDGFKKLVGPALDTLERLDPARYDMTISAQIERTFQRTGIDSVMEAMRTAITAKDFDAAVKAFNEYAKFRGDVRKLAGQSAQNPYADREAALNERESEQGKEQERIFKAGVRSEVNTAVTSEMNRLLRQSIKVQRVPSQVANRIRQEIISVLQRTVNSNSDYARNYQAVIGSRNHERAVRFIVSNARAKLGKVISGVLAYPEYKYLANGAGGNGNRAAGSDARRRPAGSPEVRGRDAGPQFGVPKVSEVDFSRTDKAAFLAAKSNRGHFEGWLVNGKKFKF